MPTAQRVSRKRATVATSEPSSDSAPTPRAVLVPQKHGGALIQGTNYGNAGNRTGNGGVTPDAVREKLRRLSHDRVAPFLAGLFEGEVLVRFVGHCRNCRHKNELADDEEFAQALRQAQERITESITHRLKASDTALRHGLPAQVEQDLATHPEFQRRMSALRTALLEVCGEEMAVQVVARAEELSL